MLLSTLMSVDQFASSVDEMLDDSGSADKMFNSPDDETSETTEAVQQSPEPSAEDMAERLWWDKCETLAKIKDCARMIEEVEGEVDSYQDQIKEAKEVLKGQQALLARYSSQLADILDGHPLPKNPNKTQTPEGSPEADSENGDWRNVSTESLLDGVKGLGKKKLDSITEAAPTAGKLEELRGQASVQHKHFKEVLPKGCGESMADEIENRLLDLIAKRSAVIEDAEEAAGQPAKLEDFPHKDEEYEDIE